MFEESQIYPRRRPKRFRRVLICGALALAVMATVAVFVFVLSAMCSAKLFHKDPANFDSSEDDMAAEVEHPGERNVEMQSRDETGVRETKRRKVGEAVEPRRRGASFESSDGRDFQYVHTNAYRRYKNSKAQQSRSDGYHGEEEDHGGAWANFRRARPPRRP